jgi:hypothetical protein
LEFGPRNAGNNFLYSNFYALVSHRLVNAHRTFDRHDRNPGGPGFVQSLRGRWAAIDGLEGIRNKRHMVFYAKFSCGNTRIMYFQSPSLR